MNAAEQASTIEFTSKIAAIVGLFKSEVPDLRADLKPWADDPETQDLIDPHSVDIGFHFPGVSRLFQCRSLLIQIRLHQDLETHQLRVIGLEVGGFDHRGQQWRLSTIDNWQFEGQITPDPTSGESLRNCCRRVFEVFNH
ncbi:MAG: hypothetical protein DCF15_02590 [Phormidesmis priestleyi]|uniref:Uncharacterized protein n=1 Tax=Phormidesmis priestleyi TaxID=268141 RepID=A0A2W4XTI2_9CYAN|nr:MAG: hypothetical protein DCF15_02590 [Phormidesmis priestleyi]